MISMRSRLAITASSLIFVALSASAALAADAAVADDSGLATILVTAEKRPE